MSSVQPPEGSTHIVKMVINIYRAQDGTIHYVENAEVRGDDPNAEDANIQRALIEIAQNYGPPSQPRHNICAGTGTYGDALEAMWSMLRVRRRGWNSKNIWVALQLPDENSKMTEPYTYIRTEQGGIRPWQATGADQLSDDWEIVPQEPV